jgi:epoxyqueuosine reductase
MELTATIRHTAHELGFDYCRFVPVEEAAHADFFDAWVALDRPGEMTYLTRHQDKRRNPSRLAEGEQRFQTLIVLGVNHHQFDLPPALRNDPSRGIIASYAWGDDYHEIMRPQLHRLDAFIAQQTGRATRGKCLVDTGPVLERDWAQRAGLGFTGKNCCTIHPIDGSWILLATVLIPEVLDYDPPPSGSENAVTPQQVLDGLSPTGSYGQWQFPGDALPLTSHPSPLAATCGRCTRCLDACPTDAFVGPFHLDPRRCISYWTIEARSPIPRALRPAFANRIFGCDICQEVCPWNKRLPTRTPLLAGLTAREERIAPPLLDGFAAPNPYWLDDEAFRAHFRRSPVKRPKRAGMLRNVCVALGNWGNPAAIEALVMALHDPEPLARGHAAWALGRIARGHPESAASKALNDGRRAEQASWVLEEIALALG